MLFKNDLRPATAGAGADGAMRKREFSPITMDSSASTSDFGSFSEGATRSHSTAPTSGKGGKKGKALGTGAIIAIVAAVLAVAAILSIAVFALVSIKQDITYADNAYMVYSDSSDAYHIVANGEIIDQVFDGDIELTVSADKSFAYVVEDSTDGYKIYLLEGKKISPLLGGLPVERIVAMATLEPGIIYVDSRGESTNYMIYNEDDGEEQIIGEKEKPEDFIISGDGRTVAFTTAGKDINERILNIFQDRNVEEAETKNLVPVAVSNYGDYVYVQRTVEGVASLAVHDVKDKKTYGISGSKNFRSILEMNVKGNEVIFCTMADSIADAVEDEALVTSYLYRYDAKPDEAIVELGKNFVTSATVDPDVAIHKTFKDCYFTSTNRLAGELEENATYYLNRKYERVALSNKYSGKFTDDGKYFYYINDENQLIQMDLKSKKRDTTIISKNTIEDFSITSKGNIYFLSGEYLYYCKQSTIEKEKVSYTAKYMSFHNRSNKLYFSAATADGTSTQVYVTEESINSDLAKLDGKELGAIPYFTDPTAKRSYAIILNEDTNTYSVFYTSSGSRFDFLKKVENCETIYINGEELDLSDYVIE